MVGEHPRKPWSKLVTNGASQLVVDLPSLSLRSVGQGLRRRI